MLFEKKKTVVLTVGGMMCQHCAGRVKEALEKVAGVKSAVVDLDAGTATVVCKESADEAAMRAAVVEAGFTVA